MIIDTNDSISITLVKESTTSSNVNPHSDILEASKKLLQKNKEAYEVLANEEN